MQGRVETWSIDDGYRNVSDVKAYINHDVSKHMFHPEWLSRRELLHRELFHMMAVHDQSIEAPDEEALSRSRNKLERLQKRMREEVNECDFHPDGNGADL